MTGMTSATLGELEITARLDDHRRRGQGEEARMTRADRSLIQADPDAAQRCVEQARTVPTPRRARRAAGERARDANLPDA